MEKRGGSQSKILAIVFAIALTILFIVGISTAVKLQSKYYIGDSVKLDLKGLGDYTLKLTTPSTSYFTHGNDTTFSFRPKEVGKYTVSVTSNKGNNDYSFDVYEKGSDTGSEQITNNAPGAVLDDFSSGNDSNAATAPVHALPSPEIRNNWRMENATARFYANQPAKWNVNITNKTGKVKLPRKVLSVNAFAEDGSTVELQSKNVSGVQEVSAEVPQDKPFEIEYYTEGPKSSEKDLSNGGVEVQVYADDGVNYTDVLVSADLNSSINYGDEVSVYWKEGQTYVDANTVDEDGDGQVDTVQWISPDANHQTFIIIVITNAEHLDSNRTFISDIYSEVKERDGTWSEAIPANDYVRVTFESNLSKENDITIWPHVLSGTPVIRVYERDGSTALAEFTNIQDDQYNKVYLTNLAGEQDSFDLLVLNGSVTFDHIVDPTLFAYNGPYNIYTNTTSTVLAQPPASGNGWRGANASQSCYNNLTSMDRVVCKLISSATNVDAFLSANFTITQNPAIIQSINITVTGNATSSGGAEDLNVYVANFTSTQTWATVGQTKVMANLTLQLNSNFSNYIRNGKLALLMIGADLDNNEGIAIDYINITVRTRYPAVLNITFPRNITYLSKVTNVSQMNYTYFGDGFCWYSTDNWATNSTPVSCETNFTNLLVDEGTNTWLIGINDSLGNLNMSNVTFNSITDNDPPNITFIPYTDSNNSVVLRKSILVNVSATDEFGLKNITVRLYNSSMNLINQSNTSNTFLFFNFSNLRDGEYYFNATAYDLSGNVNKTETWKVNVSTSAPNIRYELPTYLNASYFTKGSFNINVSATDNDGIKNITIFLYNSTRQLIDSQTALSSPNFANFSGLSDGTYYINATAYDNPGNINFTQTMTYFVSEYNPAWDIGITALNNDTFAAVWTTGQRVALEIFNTSMESLTGTILVSPNGTNASRVGITSINNSKFMVGWYDQGSGNILYKQYNISGVNLTGSIVPDTAGGPGTRISLVHTGNSFQYCFVDDAANDFLLRTFQYNTLGAGALTSIDTNIGSTTSTILPQPVDCAPLNSTHFIGSYFDNNANNMRYIIMTNTGTQVITTPTLDTSVTDYGMVAAGSANNNRIMIAWEDFTGTDAGSLEYTILTNTGTTVANDQFVEANVGRTGATASSRIRVATVSSPTTTSDLFLLAWNDQNKSAIRGMAVNVSGSVIYGPYDIATDENTTHLIFDVYGKQPVTNTSICKGKYVVGYSNITGSLNFKTMNIDGTPWDGKCNQQDLDAPIINLIAPDDGANVVDSFDFNFVYNVTDDSIVDSCSIIVDGAAKQLSTSVVKSTNQSFSQYIPQGTHNWSIECTDSLGNTGYSENRSINVALVQSAFATRFYETYDSNYPLSTIATIRLNNTRDGTQNQNPWQVSPLTNEVITRAYTEYMGNNGGFIRAGTPVAFSSSFLAANNNIRLTWKLFVSNSSGNYLLCQNGNDAAAGIQLTTATLSRTNTTCISGNVRLQPSDRILFQTHAYNTNAGTQSITHVWDGATSSFVDFNLTTEGFLDLNMSAPIGDQALATGQQMVISCTVACTIGICRNTQVYIQYNTTSANWTNVTGSGNLIMAAGGGNTNPRTLGNITTTFTTVNFTVQASINSTNFIRCVAAGTYDNETTQDTLQVDITLSNNPPGLSLFSPANGTWFNYTNITFYYNISDINNNLANSTLILDGINNRTNSTGIINGILNNYTVNITNGFHNWTVNATDTTNLNGSANITRYFYIDTLRPVINLTGPVRNQTMTGTSTILFNYTVSDNLAPLLNCNLTLDGVVVNTSINTPNGSMINLTLTGVSAGFHLWNVTCIDIALNRNTSLTFNFTIGNTPPTVSLITPNNSAFNTSTIVLRYNATDNVQVLRSQLILNGALNSLNQSVIQNAQINNFTLTLPDGLYNWSVNVTDNGGLNGSAPTFFFVIDSNPPDIQLNLPLNFTSTNLSSVNFSFTVTDTLSTILACNLSVADRILSLNVTNGTLVNRTLSGFTDGVKFWNVTCVDPSNNRNTSASRMINITSYPTISLGTANNTNFNTTTFNLTYTPADNTNLSQCILFIDGVVNIGNQSGVRNGLPNNFSLSSFPEGNFNWSVMCLDYFGLANMSETRTFGLDVTPPAITLAAPANNGIFADRNVVFNFTAVDTVALNLTCNISVNGLVMESNTTINGTLTSRTIPFSDGGDYYWNVICRDPAGNTNMSETWNFTLSFPPKVNLTAPPNGYIFNTSIISLFYNASDTNNNIDNSTLFINGDVNATNSSEIINDEISNFTISLPDGFYNWSVSVADTTNLVGNSTPRNFSVDSTPPSVFINSPNDSVLFTWNNLTFNFTAVDNIDTNLNCSLYIDGVSEVPNINILSGLSYSQSVQVVKSDGNYNFSVGCFDDGSNLNFSETRFFSVLAPPNVTLLSPTNQSILNLTNLQFVYLPQDAIGFTNCSLYLDGTMNQSTDIVNANVNNTFNVNGLVEGYHEWTVSCTDAFPDFNVFTANLSNFTLDKTKPSIILSVPANNTNTLRRVTFNFTALDNFDQNLSCNLYIDSNLNRSNVSALNGSMTSLTVSGISQGSHTWNVTCIDDALNSNFSQTWIFNATLPDLFVNGSSITFNNTNPKENEGNSINATIMNLANVSAQNVTVQFFLGDPRVNGVQLGSNVTVANFPALSSMVVSVNISSSGIGYSNVFVLVDPNITVNGTIEEINETNNIANNTVIVSAWEFVYGHMTPDNSYTLANNGSQQVAQWAVSTFSSANIYVADYDSVIFWPNLRAIGKNTLDQNTTNDFADIDTLLNMTGLSDSVAHVFTNDTPTNYMTDSFSIFKRVVGNVPIAPSTNNTNFMTGILWDTTKNTNTEFDTANKEDIVFVTKVNQNAAGAYGTYDYEIRVPARLRSYNPAENSKVSFYSEIN